jgi:hypothetical protein
LERKLTSAIESCSKEGSRGIVVVYGDLCHPRIKKIVEKFSNVVKVDALNCIDSLLGGHGRLFGCGSKRQSFLSFSGMEPSNLEKNIRFQEVFDWSQKGIKNLFKDLKGVIIIDSLGNLDEFKSDIEDFSCYTGLPVKSKLAVGTYELKAVILEAIRKLEKH